MPSLGRSWKANIYRPEDLRLGLFSICPWICNNPFMKSSSWDARFNGMEKTLLNYEKKLFWIKFCFFPVEHTSCNRVQVPPPPPPPLPAKSHLEVFPQACFTWETVILPQAGVFFPYVCYLSVCLLGFAHFCAHFYASEGYKIGIIFEKYIY